MQIYRFLASAMRGYFYYAYLSIRFSRCRFIFFVEDDTEITRYGFELLKEYIPECKVNNIIIFALSDSLVKKIKNKQYIGIKISNSKMRDLSNLYILKDISNKSIFVSTMIPYDTGANRLLGIHDINKRKIVYYDIFRMDLLENDKNKYI